MSRPNPLDPFNFDRIILADVYPRKEDPWRPGVGVTPASAPGPSFLTPEQLQQQIGAGNPLSLTMTQPGQRPIVYLRANNFSINVTTNPQPLQAAQYQCDGFLINVPSTASPSVFFGYGSNVSTTNGYEVQPGLPQGIFPDNTREMWELQRTLEYIAAMLALQLGYNPLDTFRTPRVVIDASQWWVVALSNVTCSVTLFSVPEQQ